MKHVIHLDHLHVIVSNNVLHVLGELILMAQDTSFILWGWGIHSSWKEKKVTSTNLK